MYSIICQRLADKSCHPQKQFCLLFVSLAVSSAVHRMIFLLLHGFQSVNSHAGVMGGAEANRHVGGPAVELRDGVGYGGAMDGAGVPSAPYGQEGGPAVVV